jgi:hypothetical protein
MYVLTFDFSKRMSGKPHRRDGGETYFVWYSSKLKYIEVTIKAEDEEKRRKKCIGYHK